MKKLLVVLLVSFGCQVSRPPVASCGSIRLTSNAIPIMNNSVRDEYKLDAKHGVMITITVLIISGLIAKSY